MAFGLLEFRAAGQIAQYRNAGSGLYLRLAECEVPFAGDAVQYDAGQVHAGVELLVAQYLGGHAAGHCRGVGHQYDGGAEELGQLGRGAFLVEAGMAVEHAHDPLHHGDLAAGGRLGVQLQHRAMRKQPGIQVPRGNAAGDLMVGGVDVVRPGLEGLDGVAAAGQRAHDAGGDGGLAHPAANPGYYDCWSHAPYSRHPCQKSLTPFLPNATIAQHSPRGSKPPPKDQGLLVFTRHSRESGNPCTLATGTLAWSKPPGFPLSRE